MKRLLLLLLLPPLYSSAMELVPVDIQSKQEAVTLYHNNADFYVENDNAAYRVEKHNVDPLLKEVLKRNALAKFKEAGYIRVNELESGKYALLAKVRGLGGTGPITAGIVGMIVRVGCYTGYIAAATAPVVVGTAITGPQGGVAAGVAVQAVLQGSGGVPAVIAATEALAMKATLATLLLPFPLP